MAKKVIFSFLLLMTNVFPVYAQTDHCGNDLIWQLEVNAPGQVSESSGRGVRVYNEPDGEAITRLTAGSAFKVMAGPQCGTDGRSWWQIETEAGISGWVFEGSDGTYVIEPIYNVDGCADAMIPRLTVGRFAKVIAEPAQFWNRNGQFVANDSPIALDPDVLIIESTVCYQKQYLWRILRPQDDPSNFGELWLAETTGDQYSLEPTSETLDSIPGYDLPDITLSDTQFESGAPIIQGQSQLTFFGGAGGGGGGFSLGCNELPERLQQEAPGCFYVALPPKTNEVGINFINPMGEVSKSLYYVYDSPPDSPYRNVEFVPPTGLDLPLGIWIIEFALDDQMHYVAYLLEPYVPTAPTILSGCNDYSPILKFVGFTPQETLTIRAVEATTSGSVVEYRDIGQWQLTVGDKGTGLAKIDFVVKQGKNVSFVVEDYLASPQSIVTPYFFPCITPISVEAAINTPITYDSMIFGGGERQIASYYAFEGTDDDVVTIRLIVTDDTHDPLLQLYSPNGSLLAENDDAANPIFGELDSEIARFELNESGIFTIVATTIDETSGFYFILTLEG